MDALREWASRNNIALVDIIKILNEERDVLVSSSWVHLTPRGNMLVAEAFAEEILRTECP